MVEFCVPPSGTTAEVRASFKFLPFHSLFTLFHTEVAVSTLFAVCLYAVLFQSVVYIHTRDTRTPLVMFVGDDQRDVDGQRHPDAACGSESCSRPASVHLACLLVPQGASCMVPVLSHARCGDSRRRCRTAAAAATLRRSPHGSKHPSPH